MDFRIQLLGGITRPLALLCLAIGLADLAGLLGVTSSGSNPVSAIGVTAFFLMAAFALGKTFAAVGLWIQSSWGAALLALTVVIELFLAITGIGGIDVGFIGFVFRLILLFGAGGILVWAQIKAMDLIHD